MSWSEKISSVGCRWMAGTADKFTWSAQGRLLWPGVTETNQLAPTYIVAPSTQGANSAPPKSKLSLLVGWPEAVLSIRLKIRWPHCCTLSSPSRMVPQLTSISSSIRLYIAELVASLIEGAGLQPNTLPRPVVKQTRLAPPAPCPVAATGS